MKENFILKWTNKGPEVIPYEKAIIDYETIRNLIGGMITYVSYVWFGDYKFEIIVDDEGLLKRLPITFNVLDLESNEFQSPLFGPAIIVKYDSEGNTLALTREEVLYVMIFCVYRYENNFFVLLDNQHINRINEMLSILFGNNG